MTVLPSRDELDQKLEGMSPEERLQTLVGYLQLARRQMGRMMENSRRQGDEVKASGIAIGHSLVADIIDSHYADVADQVADHVDMADAVHRVRMRELLL